MRKRMLKSRQDESDTLIKDNKRSILTNHHIEKSCESNIFTDEITNEASEFSNKSDEFQNNTKPFTSQFKILKSGPYCVFFIT